MSIISSIDHSPFPFIVNSSIIGQAYILKHPGMIPKGEFHASQQIYEHPCSNVIMLQYCLPGRLIRLHQVAFKHP